MITEIEQQTSDIDWFFTNGEHIAFVASGGGKLPSSISSNVGTSYLAAYCRLLDTFSPIVINPDLDKIVPDFDENYLVDFKSMAQKGFFAFDKSVLNDFADMNYHLVASPLNPLKLSDLEKEVADILNQTKAEGRIDKDFNLIQFHHPQYPGCK